MIILTILLGPSIHVTMSDQVSDPVPHAQSYFPVLLGTMISCPLFGVAVVQSLYYYRSYAKDPRYIKILVGTLMLLEGVHTFCLVDATRTLFLETKLSNVAPKSLLSTFFVTYTIISLVQSAYTVRVWHLSGKKTYIAVFLLFFSFVQFVGGVGSAITTTIGGSPHSVLDHSSQYFGSTSVVASVICDMAITISSVYFLHTSRTGFRRTEKLIDKLIIYSLNTGLLTTILALASLMAYLVMPQNFDFFTIYFILTKIYVNSLLVTLNSRARFRRDLHETEELELNVVNDVLRTSLGSP